MPEELDPFVRVVVLNWNSAWFTHRCLRALARTEYPADRFEVVLVDNGSVDGSLERLRDWFPDLEVIANGRNLGFAEGCNRAMRDRRGIDAVALVNNDAVVEPGWLRPLVDAFAADERIGAASALLVLEPGFLPLDVSAEGAVSVRRVTVDGVDVTGAVRFGGFVGVSDAAWPLERTWCLDRGTGRIWVPSGEGASRIGLDLDGHGRVVVEHDGTRLASPTPGSFDLAAADGRVRLLNGLGTARNERCEGYDRHYGEPADGPDGIVAGAGTDGIVDVDGFCGGAALLRSSMLDEVGLFDPRLFAYYEDTDLSWRSTRAGWRVVAVPASVVEHAFGASGGSRASGFFHLDRRNWWLTAERNGTEAQRRLVRSEVRREIRTALRANIAGRIKRRRTPSFLLLRAWGRIVADHGIEMRRRARRSHPTAPRRPIGAIATDDVRGRFQPASQPRLPGARPWGPVPVLVDVSELVAAAPGASWSEEALDCARSLVAELLQDHPELDAVAVVADSLRGTTVAGPHDHHLLLGRGPRPAPTLGTPDGSIVVEAPDLSRLQLRAASQPPGFSVCLRLPDGRVESIELADGPTRPPTGSREEPDTAATQAWARGAADAVARSVVGSVRPSPGVAES